MTDRSRAIAVSFAKRYYNTLVEDASQLGLFYTPTARVEHHGRKAHNAEVQALLSSLYPQGSVTGAYIDSVTAVRTASGATEVEITGTLVHADREQPFRQKAQLREVLENTFAIITDNVRPWVAVSHTVAAANWALAESTPVQAPVPAKEAEPLQELTPPAAAEAAAPAPAEPAKAKTPEPSAAAEEVVDTTGMSFAERLRLKQSSKAAGDHVVRVTATTEAEAAAKANAKKDKAAAAKEKKEKDGDGASKEHKRPAEKAGQPSEDQGDAAGKEGANGTRREKRRKGIVYYDIVVKGLPSTASEASVRELVGSAAAVRHVKVESAPAKKDANQIRTFAFVQLDQQALKAAGQSRSDAIAAVLADARARKVVGNGVQLEEVHDKLLPEKE